MLALRLRQGKKALLQGWSHDSGWQARYVVQFHRDHLLPHFEAEERILFPVMREHAKESVGTIETLLNQHKEITARVESLKESEQTSLKGKLKEFGELLDRHIRIEEEDLFPAFERSIPKGIAEEVGKEIERIHKPPAK
jgi:hemerythrin-like domain-containing protein